MKNVLLNLLVLVTVLGLPLLITSWFARTMYVRCVGCGTLNARRRSQCRSCEQDLFRA